MWIVRMTCANAGPLASTPMAFDGSGVIPRRLVTKRFQEAGDAVAGGRRSHQHRHDVTIAQFAREIVEYPIAGRLDVADELLHQGVVIIGQALQHRIARLPSRRELRPPACRATDEGARIAVDEGAFERQVDKTSRHAVLPTGIWRRSSGVREAGCRSSEHFSQAAAGLVDLVEEEDARNLRFLEFPQR